MDKTRHEGKTRRNIIVERFFEAQINEKGRRKVIRLPRNE